MPVQRPAYASGPGESRAGWHVPACAGAMLLALALAAALLTGSHGLGAPIEPSTAPAASQYAKLPVSFIPNRGQINRDARYYAQGAGFSFFFTDDEVVLTLAKGKRGQALELSFVGANPSAELEARERAAGEVNYLTGAHHTNIPTYGELAYRDLWPGIDMVFRGSGGALKYEFLVDPGADPSDIRLAWGGASGLSTDEAGRLLIGTPLGALTDARPRSFQRIGGKRVPVRSGYAIGEAPGASPAFGFTLGRYDRKRPLVIDPSISYSTLLGGGNYDYGYAIAVDADGSAYVTGTSRSAGFPTTPGAFDTSEGGSDNAFVTKLSPDGSTLVYSTFLGGSFPGSIASGNAIAVDGQGSAYVGGGANSQDFPTTPGAFDTTSSDSPAFVTKLTPDGSGLAYSTFLSGDSGYEFIRDLAIDSAGRAYVIGYTSSEDFPTTPGAFDSTLGVSAGYFDAFVTKLNPSGSALAYSTFLGGSGTEYGEGIAVDDGGNAYLTGDTDSLDFPTTPGAYSTSRSVYGDLFVAKLDTVGSTLEYSTYLGGFGDDIGAGIAVDGEGRAHVTGVAYPPCCDGPGYPTTPGAYNTALDHGAFVTRLTADGTDLSYSTFLGVASAECCGFAGGGIAVHDDGSAYVTGTAFGSGMPTTSGAHDTSPDNGDNAFLTRLSEDGSALIYSSYLGGGSTDIGNDVAVDGAGDAYVTGHTLSTNFPTTEGAYDRTRNGHSSVEDAFVTKLATSGPELFAGRLIVKKDAQPDNSQDFSFTAGGGLSPSTFQLDDDPSDSTLAGSRVFDSVSPGTYSVSESTSGGWKQISATCDDGSSPSSIDVSSAEIVVCTFVNRYLAGHARPKAAPYLDIRLVPAFEECVNANAEHGAPLAVPSCSPPAQTSDFLTFNAPDRAPPHFNDPALGSARLRLQLVCTNGSQPPCGAGLGDVSFEGSVTDVRCTGSSGGCAGAGAAYSGKVLFVVPLRITDRQNGASEDLTGTVLESAFAFRAGVECIAGDCNLSSSAEAVYPADVIKEGKRTIWQLGRVSILDGGQDGDFDGPPDCPPTCFPNDDETVFLQQGLFVP